MYLFCYSLLGALAVGEIRTDIAVKVEKPTDLIAVTGDLTLIVNEIETDDGEEITDEWTSGSEAVIDNVLDLVVIEELLNE